MTELAEIKGLVEQINPTLVELRKEVDELKASAPKDVVTEEKHNKMAEAITAQMAELQAKQAKIEAAAQRLGGGEGKGENAELEAKHKAMFRQYISHGQVGEAKESRDGIEIKAMSTDVNPDGGYLVRPQFLDMVVTRIFETSPLRQVANVEQTGSKSVEMLIDDNEAAARWVGEGASGGQTDTPQVGIKSIVAHKLEADPRLTTEQVEDSYLDVEAWLGRKVAEKFSRMENTSFISGTGVSQPRGLLTYAAWASAGVYERDKVEQINLGAAAALTAEGLIKLQNGLKEGYQPGAVFGMKRATFGAALQLKGNDSFFFSPVMLRDGQSALQLLGKPVVFMDDMPAVGANALSIIYGDFSMGYTIVDRVGLQVLRDPFTNKGFITLYTTRRTGGDVTNFDAFKIGKVAA